jgi:hypothetical protein
MLGLASRKDQEVFQSCTIILSIIGRYDIAWNKQVESSFTYLSITPRMNYLHRTHFLHQLIVPIDVITSTLCLILCFFLLPGIALRPPSYTHLHHPSYT